jgi:hypothetical protein
MEDKIKIDDQLREVLQRHLRLFTLTNPKKKAFYLDTRVTGYSDVMYQIANLVKVSILALEAQEVYSSYRIPEPNINISGVLSSILNMLPYEEMHLLDIFHDNLLDKKAAVDTIAIGKDEIPVYNFSAVRIVGK